MEAVSAHRCHPLSRELYDSGNHATNDRSKQGHKAAVGTFVTSKGCVHVGSSPFDHDGKLEASFLVHSGQM